MVAPTSSRIRRRSTARRCSVTSVFMDNCRVDRACRVRIHRQGELDQIGERAAQSPVGQFVPRAAPFQDRDDESAATQEARWLDSFVRETPSRSARSDG